MEESREAKQNQCFGKSTGCRVSPAVYKQTAGVKPQGYGLGRLARSKALKLKALEADKQSDYDPPTPLFPGPQDPGRARSGDWRGFQHCNGFEPGARETAGPWKEMRRYSAGSRGVSPDRTTRLPRRVAASGYGAWSLWRMQIPARCESWSAGVYEEYCEKPLSLPELSALIQDAHERTINGPSADNPVTPAPDYGCGELVGSSPKAKAVYDLIQRVAGLNAFVLITGESGTGKELIAHAIHSLGPGQAQREQQPVRRGFLWRDSRIADRGRAVRL